MTKFGPTVSATFKEKSRQAIYRLTLSLCLCTTCLFTDNLLKQAKIMREGFLLVVCLQIYHGWITVNLSCYQIYFSSDINQGFTHMDNVVEYHYIMMFAIIGYTSSVLPTVSLLCLMPALNKYNFLCILMWISSLLKC